ncbi:arsenate reductase (glutaredoxin) [Octadecabacter sp. R77987]|uniref:arsenate reductase (glutaredoxin) n=1 Tax=Octadecabacter sp. R77987 TaxID=3093874 RepID=UPI0036711378
MILWHNPRCSKSRQTLALLAAQDPDVRLYLQDAPTLSELTQVATLLGGPRAMIRKGEAVYKELGLKDADDAALLAAMAAHPILIERPILLANGRAALGRPPENVLTIL